MINIGTYNVHRLEDLVGVNGFLTHYNVDACGMQEVSGVSSLKSLPCVMQNEMAYVFDGHYKTYGNGLVYRKSAFDFVSTETFIISKDVKKSVKTHLKVKLKHLDSQKNIVFHVTHLTHHSEALRFEEIQNVVKNICLDEEFYILADLNALCLADFDNNELKSLTELRLSNKWEPPEFKVHFYLESLNFVDLFKSEPLPTCRFNTRVDYILTLPKYAKNVLKTHTLDIKGSDHKPLLITLMDTTPKVQSPIIKFVDTSYRYGFHVQKQTSIYKTIKDVLSREVSSMQFFTSNPKSKYPPSFDLEDLAAARRCLELHQEMYVVIHGCLLYNLAGSVEGEDYHQSLTETIKGLTAELDYAIALGRPSGVGVGVIIHPGSRKDRDEGHTLVSKTIAKVLTLKTNESGRLSQSMGISEDEFIKRRKLIIENSAGEGTKLCATLEEIRGVISSVPKELQSQVSVCIDTAHIYGAGKYDFGAKNEIQKFYEDFDRIIGLDKLEVFHFNDSMKSDKKAENASFGSRKDRHQNLGLGYIFDSENKERYSQIRTFMEKAKLHKIPIIGEPPGEGKDDWKVVKKLLAETDNPLEWEK